MKFDKEIKCSREKSDLPSKSWQVTDQKAPKYLKWPQAPISQRTIKIFGTNILDLEGVPHAKNFQNRRKFCF